MWREYSSGYVKNNRSSAISVVTAAFISALLLSLLCGLFYNAWKYEVERIQLEEGSWQSRITGTFNKEEIEIIRNSANVKSAVVHRTADGEQIIELCFERMGTVPEDTVRIAGLTDADPERITYHHELLAMYLVRDPLDPAPRLLFPLFLLIIAIAAISLIVVIHNSFVVSMNARIHQFGIFSSVGATPGQIRACLLQEAAVLCALPAVIGNLLGILAGRGVLYMINILLEESGTDRHEAVFGYHPLVIVFTMLVTFLTIWISAWIPAWKLSRLTPVEAIRSVGEFQLKHRKNSLFLSLIFGAEGELAGNALKAQRKTLRTASLSLVCSFMAFTVMQCFFTMSGISTEETYFARFQDVWDVMVTVKNTNVEDIEEIKEIQALSGVRTASAYQKAEAKRIVKEEELSDEMKGFGGFSHASEKDVTQTEEGWKVNAPVIILDDAAFLTYCEQIGISPRLDGAVIRNQICDVTNPDFRHPQYMSYIKTENPVSVLLSADSKENAEIPVLCYTDQVPVLREEYAKSDYYELVHFVPVSLWKKVKNQVAGCEENSYICVLGNENITAAEADALEENVLQILGGRYKTESENRIREKETNDKQIQGMRAIFGGFCVLLAVIGVGNVFSNTLGFVRQRRREFARYMSVGMTPGELRKMFCIEALVIAGRPVLLTILLAVPAVWYMLQSSYLEVDVFLAEAPVVPVIMFMLAIWATVALAYYLGWRSVRGIDLAEVLRDDTMI